MTARASNVKWRLSPKSKLLVVAIGILQDLEKLNGFFWDSLKKNLCLKHLVWSYSKS